MVFKLKDLKKVMNQLQYNLGISDDGEVEITIRDEDFEANKIGSAMIISVETTKRPSGYDKSSKPTKINTTIELYPINENQPPRLSSTETKVLDLD